MKIAAWSWKIPIFVGVEFPTIPGGLTAESVSALTAYTEGPQGPIMKITMGVSRYAGSSTSYQNLHNDLSGPATTAQKYSALEILVRNIHLVSPILMFWYYFPAIFDKDFPQNNTEIYNQVAKGIKRYKITIKYFKLNL